MNKIQFKTKNETKFIDYFISKERDFLYSLNPKAFNDKDFRFYMEWYICAIDEYMQESYDIEERFTFFFTNNFNLNIIFFIYIMSANFRNRVIDDIAEYKQKYGKENIYE